MHVCNLTEQQILDKVVQHLAQQKQRSIIGETCRYRIQKSGKILECAIGCLIPKRSYSPEMEGSSIWALIETRNIFFPKIRNTQFLSELQNIHDMAYNAEVLKERLEEIAKDWQLAIDTSAITEWR
jgi:hypothetical protein